MVVIVDVGLGNVASVFNMLSRLGVAAMLCDSPTGRAEGDRYILPGVGAFDEGVVRLRQSGWFDHLKELPTSTHILGICLGMQLLARSSEEGREVGLARVPAHFERFPDSTPRIPHMGWNQVTPTGSDPIFDPAIPDYRFYFTHSFRAVVEDSATEIARTDYSIPFTSAYCFGNTRGVQFHPEKSHRFGMSLLLRWSTLPC